MGRNADGHNGEELSFLLWLLCCPASGSALLGHGSDQEASAFKNSNLGFYRFWRPKTLASVTRAGPAAMSPPAPGPKLRRPCGGTAAAAPGRRADLRIESLPDESLAFICSHLCTAYAQQSMLPFPPMLPFLLQHAPLPFPRDIASAGALCMADPAASTGAVKCPISLNLCGVPPASLTKLWLSSLD